jgi:ABC-2 type transport system permease protein
VFIVLIVQVGVLIGASSALFGVQWGDPLGAGATALGTIVVAAGFGVLLMSFIQNTRQTGPVMGGLMTVMGMLGGLFTTGIPSLPKAFDAVNLLVPQGWALRGWKLVLSGAPLPEILGTTAIMVAIGVALFAAGVLMLRRRFA